MYTNPYAFKDLSNNYLIPTVIEKTTMGERAYDIYSRLLKDRIIMLGSQIDDDIANIVVPSYYFSKVRTKRKISNFTSTPQAGLSRQGWRFMMPCNTSNRMFQRFASEWPLRWALFFWLAERKGNDSHYPTPKS